MTDFADTPISTEKVSSLPYFLKDDDYSTMIISTGYCVKEKKYAAHNLNSTTLSKRAKEKVGSDITDIIVDLWSSTLTESEDLLIETQQSGLEFEGVDNVNRDRIELLARKYARKNLSKEDTVRLEIVRERMRKLVPRVTTKDFENLVEIAEDINRIGDEDDRLREELGLKNR